MTTENHGKSCSHARRDLTHMSAPDWNFVAEVATFPVRLNSGELSYDESSS